MKNAIEKVDRFLERYRQLCLEEGVHINGPTELSLHWNETAHAPASLEDSLDEIRNNTIHTIQFSSGRKWKDLDE